MQRGNGEAGDGPAVDPVPGLPRWSVAVLVWLGLGLLACSLVNPFAFVPDDSLFYLVIARNIADGNGITFSQVMDTNGFQPLWPAVVAALITFAELLGIRSDASQVAAMILASWAFLAGGLVLLHRLLAHLRIAGAAGFAALAAVLVLLGGPYGTLATEANLVLMALVVVLLVARRLITADDDRSHLAADRVRPTTERGPGAMIRTSTSPSTSGGENHGGHRG